MSDVKQDIKDIKESIKRIETNLEKMSKVHEKLSDHINFVESTYDTLRSPLSFVTTQINRLIGTDDHRELPRIIYLNSKKAK